MPRTAVCVICAMLASVAAALLLLMPSPALAQEAPKAEVTLGGKPAEGFTPLRLVATLKMLGSEDAVPGFKLLVMAKYTGDAHENATTTTNDKGEVAITLNRKPDELRVFAYGEYFIPDAWSYIPVRSMKFEAAETWVMRVRSLQNVQVSGRITAEGIDTAPARANVSFAPLDVAQDGSARLFDQPYSALTDDLGRYSVALPTGYYQVWSHWTDRTGYDWIGYVAVEDRMPVFKDSTLNMTLQRGPRLKGKVIDARTGKGMAATIDLYSNVYLRQLGMQSADGVHPDAYDKDDKPIHWPVGTFDFQAWSINPRDFTVVIKPRGTNAVIRVIPDQKLAGLTDQEIVWELFTEEMRLTELVVTTHEQAIPVMELDVRLIPKKVDVPEHIRQSYSAGAITDADGVARFLGLANGSYEAFGGQGTVFLGEVVIGAAEQRIPLKFTIPFAYGTVKLPDGTTCKHMIASWTYVMADDRRYGPFQTDAFRGNPKLRERGMAFVPLLQPGSTYKLRFAAMENGREFDEGDWLNTDHFDLITEEVEIKVDGEKGWKIDLQLKPNPNHKKLKD